MRNEENNIEDYKIKKLELKLLKIWNEKWE